VSLPNSDPKPGVAWYRDTFTLDEPAGVDASLALNIADVIGKSYRATIFLNVWNLCREVRRKGDPGRETADPGRENQARAARALATSSVAITTLTPPKVV
jgi:hypothetical protein